MEKVEKLEREYGKIRKALEYIMPIIENMERENFRREAFKSRNEQLMLKG